jgi:hypothetical protein
MRLYRALLHFYPASFRNEYGDELARVFAQRVAERGRFRGSQAQTKPERMGLLTSRVLDGNINPWSWT